MDKLREIENRKNENYAKIQNIFIVFDKQFYKYLVPFVVDNFYERNIKKYTPKDFNISVDIYFEYIFPEKTFPHILTGNEHKINNPGHFDTTFRKNIRYNDINYYISTKHLINEVLTNFKNGVEGNEIIPNYKQELIKLREDVLYTPLKGVINDLLKKDVIKSPNQFKNLASVKHLHLPPDIINKGYKSYRINKEQQIKEEELEKKPHVKRPKPQNIKEYIKFKIIPSEKPDEEKTFDELYDLIDLYNYNFPINETIKGLYKFYIDERNKIFNRVNPKQLLTSDDIIKYCGYKSPNKINALINFDKTIYPKLGKNVKNYFPLKQNQKAFSLHTIAPKDSYLIDLMFENRKYCYLIAININTRKLWVEPTNVERKNDPTINKEIKENNDRINEKIKEIQENNKIDEEFKESLIEETILKQMKNSKLYIAALTVIILKIKEMKKMKMEEIPIKYLKGDGEPAFKSDLAQEFYYMNGINNHKRNEETKRNGFDEVNRQITKYPKFMKDLNMVKSIKSEPTHSSLGIIDRVIRTIRGIAFNLNYGIITPSRMNYIVDLYNNAPHNTLSKYAGKLVSPNDVDNNEELEKFIVRRIQQENYNIMTQYGFDINPGEDVIVYNERNNMAKRRSEIEPEIMKVKERKGALYVLNDGRMISRVKIHPKNKSYKYYELI